MPNINVTLNRNTADNFKSFCSKQGKKYSLAFREIMQGCLDSFPTYEAEIKRKNIQGNRSSQRNCHKNTYDTMGFQNVPDEIVNAFDKIVLTTKNVASRSAVVDYILSDQLTQYTSNLENTENNNNSATELSEEEQLTLHYLNSNSIQH